MRTLIISFELQDSESPGALKRAYSALSEIGFYGVAQDVMLPIGTVMGYWFEDTAVEEIRSLVIAKLHNANAAPVRIIVVEPAQSAWASMD